MSETGKRIDFVKGMTLKTIKTQYGTLINVGVKLEEFSKLNTFNDRGYLNFTIKQGKDSGNYYAEINDFTPQPQDNKE